MIELTASLILVAIALVRDCYTRNLVFVYGTIGLWCMCYFITPKRIWNSLPLGLLLIWSLLCIFLRGWEVGSNSIIRSEMLNVYLLTEGFIYLLCGAMLLKMIIQYSTKIWIYWLVLAISVWKLFTIDNFALRMTMPAAFVISIITYLMVNKQWKKLYWIVPLVIILFIIRLPRFDLGWKVRPFIWQDMISDIIKKPIIGLGFNDTLLPSTMTWLKAGNYGYVFAHNDYLCLGKCIGILGIIFALWFAGDYLWKLRKMWIVILPMTFMVTAFFQSTLFDAHKASIFILVLSMGTIKQCQSQVK